MPDPTATLAFDVVVVGAGAAGLFAALAARGAVGPDGTPGAPRADAPSVLLVDGQAEPGRKILISGGGRCNVTNAEVTERDFLTDDPRRVRSALREFGPDHIRAFFEAVGVPLHVEALGKVFPDSGRARDVLDALMTAVTGAGVTCDFGRPVASLAARPEGGWQVGEVVADRVVLATGGRSVPATGSTGFGLDVARDLGHDLAPTHPALAALLGEGHPDLAGLTAPSVVLALDDQGREVARSAGSLLFTHRGVTGPAPMDVSHAVEASGRGGRVVADLWTLADPEGPFGPFLDAPKPPGCCLADPPPAGRADEVDRWLATAADTQPRATVATLLGARVPRRLAAWLAGEVEGTPLGQLRKQERRTLAERLVAMDLGITGTAGYAKAEVTAGGIRLADLDRRTLESRLAPGLHACGEVCDVTGRLGGFNFQWAWTSGWLAGRGAAGGRV